ncbi:MAG: hypothetical protein V8S74_08240 [Lachnospirales bacterium]
MKVNANFEINDNLLTTHLMSLIEDIKVTGNFNTTDEAISWAFSTYFMNYIDKKTITNAIQISWFSL